MTDSHTIGNMNGGTVNPDLDELSDYTQSINKQSEILILNGFSEKILKLNKILESADFQSENMKTYEDELSTAIPEDIYIRGRRECITLGVVDANASILKLNEHIRPAIMELVEDAALLKLWIRFLIPKIEDGNNFGVSIQQTILNEIGKAESEAASWFDQMATYHETRAKDISLLSKLPNIEDNRKILLENDVAEFWRCHLVLSATRDHYLNLQDIIVKNLEKLNKPRTSRIEQFY